jgi:hypothetical protein
MRAYILTAAAVLASSTLAFFAGAHFGHGRGDRADCEPAGDEASSIAKAPEPAPAPASVAAGAVPADEVAEQPAGASDETVWPYRKWAVAPETKGDRLYSKIRFLWIRPEPRTTNTFLGYLSLGDSVKLKGGSKAAAMTGKSNSLHCTEWLAVEPRGYVCVDDEVATTDPDDPVVAMLRPQKANRLSAYPFKYGESTGTPVYATIPPIHSQRRNESALEDHLSKVRAARLAKTEKEKIAVDERFAGVDVQLTNKEPPQLLPLGALGKSPKTDVVRGSTIGFLDSFDADGRSWVLTWDRGIVPRDRVKLYPESQFHGTALDDTIKLPIAFFRDAQPRMRRDESGQVVPAEGEWPKHGFVMVTDEQVEFNGKRYLVTKQDGLLADVESVALARRSHAIPPHIQSQTEGRRTWIDVSIMQGWLVAYEYDKPVYATMIAAGRGGIPKDGVDPLVTASTPVGNFRITGKFVTATMVSNASKDIVHDEVMYTQNFSGPYALHGGYWHDDWGKPKSGGCINLAPIDARRLFAWTDPQLPEGWHSVQLVTGYEGALAEYETATLVSTHK